MTPTVFKPKLKWLRLDAAEFAPLPPIATVIESVQAMHDGRQAIPLIVERLIDVLCRNQRLEAMRAKRAR